MRKARRGSGSARLLLGTIPIARFLLLLGLLCEYSVIKASRDVLNSRGESMSVSRGWMSLFRSRRLLLIIWPFLVIAVLLVALTNESIAILSAGRAFVEGESLWSKAQKQSLVHLMRYAHTHAESDYQQFRAALAVPLGDQKARLELEKTTPDYAAAYQGFLEGRNHPDDIPG